LTGLAFSLLDSFELAHDAGRIFGRLVIEVAKAQDGDILALAEDDLGDLAAILVDDREEGLYTQEHGNPFAPSFGQESGQEVRLKAFEVGKFVEDKPDAPREGFRPLQGELPVAGDDDPVYGINRAAEFLIVAQDEQIFFLAPDGVGEVDFLRGPVPAGG